MEPIRAGEFAFTVRHGNPPNCVPVDPRWEPLAAVLTRVGEHAVRLASDKSGMNWEGVVGLYWGDGEEADVPVGKVRVHCFDKEQVLDEAVFAAAAAAWVKALRGTR